MESFSRRPEPDGQPQGSRRLWRRRMEALRMDSCYQAAGALLRSSEGGPEQPSRLEEPWLASEASLAGAALLAVLPEPSEAKTTGWYASSSFESAEFSKCLISATLDWIRAYVISHTYRGAEMEIASSREIAVSRSKIES